MPAWLPLLLGFLTAVGPISTDMYLPAFPAIEAELGTARGSVEITLASWFIGLAVGQLVQGTLADRWGRRVVFSSTAFLYGAAGAAEAFAPGFTALIGLRVVQGIGYAALMPLSMTLIADKFSTREQVKAQASRQVSLALGEP